MLIHVSILTDWWGKVKLEWVAEVIRVDNEQTIITRQKGELAGYLNYAFPDYLNIKEFYQISMLSSERKNIIVWLDNHQRSAWKYQYVECDYSLFFWGSVTFRRGTFPILSPQASSTMHGAPGTQTSSFRLPEVRCFLLGTCRRVRQFFSSWRAQI